MDQSSLSQNMLFFTPSILHNKTLSFLFDRCPSWTPPWNHLPFAPNLLCHFPLFIFWRLAAAFVLVKACVVGDPRRKSVLWFELKMKWSHHLSWQQWIWVSLVANSSCTYRCIQLTPVSAHMGRHNSTLRSLPTHFISWGRYLWKRNTTTAHDCAVIPAQ